MNICKKIIILQLVFYVLSIPVLAGEIHDAARKGDLTRIKELLKEDRNLVNLKDNRDRTALHLASYKGYKDIIEFLIANDAHINAKDFYQQTPLHWAASAGHLNIVKILVEKGAEINPRNNDDLTPLDLAKDREKRETTAFLISKGGVTTPVKDAKVHYLKKNLCRITFPYSLKTNIGLFYGQDGVLLVDTGFRRTAQKLNAHVKEITKGKIKFVINTHSHGDHVGGNYFFKEKSIIIDLANLDEMVSRGIIARGKGPIKGQSGKIFETYYTLKFNGEEIRLIPSPGAHSNTDLIIHFTSSGVVHMGDLLLSQSFPAVGPEVEKYLEILEKTIDVFPANTKFISGHGRDLTMEGVKKYKKMLLSSIAAVKAGMKTGKSVEEMQKENILKNYESYNDFLYWLNTDYWIGAVNKCYKDKL